VVRLISIHGDPCASFVQKEWIMKARKSSVRKGRRISRVFFEREPVCPEDTMTPKQSATHGTIIEEVEVQELGAARKVGVYERNGSRFIFARTHNDAFCFCWGRQDANIDVAWMKGYKEEIERGYYEP
jgi:hypothetical protein